MIVIGLTGGVASGKSTVSRILAEHGATIIDADRLGHETYRAGTETFARVVEAFGPDIVGQDGQIDRQALGRKVFGDPAAMRRLTDIVWPKIHDLARQRLKALRQQDVEVVVLEAAVLIEAGWLDLVDEVWVVTTPPEIAKRRLMRRDGLTEEQAEHRLASQLTNEARLPYADVVIENNGTREALHRRVEEAWRDLQKRLRSGQQLRAARSG